MGAVFMWRMLVLMPTQIRFWKLLSQNCKKVRGVTVVFVIKPINESICGYGGTSIAAVFDELICVIVQTIQ